MSDQVFKITAVHGSREWSGRNNSTFVDYTIELEGLDGRHTLTQKPTTPAPQIGEELLGHPEDAGTFPSGDPKPPKFVKAKPAGGFGGGGGPRPEDPARAKRILRQHSQDMGIETLKLAAQAGVGPSYESVSDIVKAVKALADVYDKDAEGAAA